MNNQVYFKNNRMHTKTKTVNEMTRKEIESVRAREWNEDIGEFDTLIILPQRRIHHSGYRVMNFVAVKDNKPLVQLSGCSDVIHINGIGGYGKDWHLKGGVPSLIEPSDWCMDCLKVSGLLQIFSSGKLSCGAALSSFEVYTEKKSK